MTSTAPARLSAQERAEWDAHWARVGAEIDATLTPGERAERDRLRPVRAMLLVRRAVTGLPAEDDVLYSPTICKWMSRLMEQGWTADAYAALGTLVAHAERVGSFAGRLNQVKDQQKKALSWASIAETATENGASIADVFGWLAIVAGERDRMTAQMLLKDVRDWTGTVAWWQNALPGEPGRWAYLAGLSLAEAAGRDVSPEDIDGWRVLAALRGHCPADITIGLHR